MRNSTPLLCSCWRCNYGLFRDGVSQREAGFVAEVVVFGAWLVAPQKRCNGIALFARTKFTQTPEQTQEYNIIQNTRWYGIVYTIYTHFVSIALYGKVHIERERENVLNYMV